MHFHPPFSIFLYGRDSIARGAARFDAARRVAVHAEFCGPLVKAVSLWPALLALQNPETFLGAKMFIIFELQSLDRRFEICSNIMFDLKYLFAHGLIFVFPLYFVFQASYFSEVAVTEVRGAFRRQTRGAWMVLSVRSCSHSRFFALFHTRFVITNR